MLTQAENERLTQVGPGTPMGELLRRYWMPVAATSELLEEPTKKVRLLGEDLVLYRDRSGNLGLIGDRCLHRRVEMVFGIPESVGLRCPYHGWLYDHTGHCLEQPAEDMEAPDSTFKQRTIIKAYPVEELGGLLWAYLGPQPAPLVPHWDILVEENVHRAIGYTILPCNWLQCMENSLDPVHTEWLHGIFDNYVLERLGQEKLKVEPKHHTRIHFEVCDYGIIKRRVVEGGSEADADWAIGHPIIFPNILKTGGFEIRVPMDDTHTFHVFYYTKRFPPGVNAPPQESIPLFSPPLPGLDQRGRPEWQLMDNNSGQDMWAFYSQGPIVDRTEERLGTSDKGVILYRKLLDENMQSVERGDDPMNVFRDPASNRSLQVATDRADGVVTRRIVRPTAWRPPRGGAQKFAAIYDRDYEQRVTEAVGA